MGLVCDRAPAHDLRIKFILTFLQKIRMSTDDLKVEIERIKERNERVEVDKAWETSVTRMAVLAVSTYVVAALTLWTIGNDGPFVNALIPTIGFLLSVQSLPLVKRWWVKRHLAKK